jgi:hypothetical protein
MDTVQDPVNRRKKISALECAIVRGLQASFSVFQCAQRVLRSAVIVTDLFREKALTRVNVGGWIRQVGDVWKLTSCVLFVKEIAAFFDDVLLEFVEREGLDGIWEMKPLISGKELAALHKVKLGPTVSGLLAALIDWQLEHPDGTLEEYVASLNV